SVRVTNAGVARDVVHDPISRPAARSVTETSRAPTTSTSPRATPVRSAPGRSIGPAHFNGYDETRREGSKAPIHFEVAGAGAGVDPKDALQYATDVITNRRAP